MDTRDLFETPSTTFEEDFKALKSHPRVRALSRVKEDDMMAYAAEVPDEDLKEIVRLSNRLRKHEKARLIASSSHPFPIMTSRARSDDGLEDNWTRKNLLAFAKNFVRVVNATKKNKLAAENRKQLEGWLTSDTRLRHLDGVTINALLAMDVRPDVPTHLYRGMMFRKFDFKYAARPAEERDTVYIKRARRFLDILKKGQRGFHLTNEQPTSWTTSSDIAARFASKNSAESEYLAMRNWLENAGRKIDGELGVVLHTIAKPEQILCDVNLVPDLSHTHGNESEMILLPGKPFVRILRVLTPAGEMDPSDAAELVQRLIDDAKVD
jgi:hypothetical protein